VVAMHDPKIEAAADGWHRVVCNFCGGDVRVSHYWVQEESKLKMFAWCHGMHGARMVEMDSLLLYADGRLERVIAYEVAQFSEVYAPNLPSELLWLAKGSRSWPDMGSSMSGQSLKVERRP